MILAICAEAIKLTVENHSVLLLWRLLLNLEKMPLFACRCFVIMMILKQW